MWPSSLVLLWRFCQTMKVLPEPLSGSATSSSAAAAKSQLRHSPSSDALQMTRESNLSATPAWAHFAFKGRARANHCSRFKRVVPQIRYKACQESTIPRQRPPEEGGLRCGETAKHSPSELHASDTIEPVSGVEAGHRAAVREVGYKPSALMAPGRLRIARSHIGGKSRKTGSHRTALPSATFALGLLAMRVCK